jgi:hypothetical protein
MFPWSTLQIFGYVLAGFVVAGVAGLTQQS